jgi:hypothetical protein
MEIMFSGYDVLRGVITPEEAEDFRQRAWIESTQLPHMANSDVMWDIRTHPNIRTIFEHVWNTTDLISSFDGIGMRKSGEKGLELGFHVDQDSTEDGMRAIQGVLALSRSDSLTGGTVILPASHFHHSDLVSRIPSSGDNWVETGHWQFIEVPDNDSIFEKCSAPVQPSLEPGDLLLWDSRTVHAVSPPTDIQTERSVAYICLGPRKFATPKTLRQRMKAFELGIHGTHWPHHFLDRGGAKGKSRSFEESPESIRNLV